MLREDCAGLKVVDAMPQFAAVLTVDFSLKQPARGGMRSIFCGNFISAMRAHVYQKEMQRTFDTVSLTFLRSFPCSDAGWKILLQTFPYRMLAKGSG